MEYETFISLGYNCQTKFTIEQIAKVGPEFVLDGLISHELPKINNLLKTNFNNFFEKDQIEVTSTDGPFYKVKDHLNQITSIHDFRNGISFEESYQETMLLKRIQYQKLLNTINKNPGNLLFVRRNKAYESLESIIELRETIALMREGKPFELYIFQNKEWMNNKLNIPNLFTFYDGSWVFDEKHGWQGDNKLWQTVFKNIKLLDSQ